MYILAGKKRLKRERETTLEELKAKAQRSGLPEDAQAEAPRMAEVQAEEDEYLGFV